jgi:hypothetical protein
LKRITTLLPIRCLVLLSTIAATGTIISQAAFAHTSNYNKGYPQGQAQARQDYSAYAQDYRPFCPVYDSWTEKNGPHSSNFCAGFIHGYNQAWYALVWKTHNQRVSQSTDQSSNVNIKGNNNRVTVNQQVNNNVGGQNSGGYGSGSYGNGHGILPRCFILCSNIQVR